MRNFHQKIVGLAVLSACLTGGVPGVSRGQDGPKPTQTAAVAREMQSRSYVPRSGRFADGVPVSALHAQTYYIGTGQREFNPGNSGQKPFINVDWKITMAATSNPPAKWVVIESVGTGISANGLKWNNKYNRGYFLEKAIVQYGPATDNAHGAFGRLPAGWSIDRHSPANANNSSNLTVTTGWTLGATVGAGEKLGGNASVSAGYSKSESSSVDLSDFRVVNRTNGVRGIWDYQLSSVGGQPYNTWSDIFDKPFLQKAHLRTVPTLAQYVLQPGNQVVYRGPVNFNGKIKFGLEAHQHLRRSWVEGDWVQHTMKTTTSRYYWYRTIDLDLSKVQPPR